MGTFVENVNAVAGVITSGVLDPNAEGYSNAVIAIEQAAICTAMADVCTTTYDNFDDRYLGAKSTPPITDNDGNTLVYGALYFDTTNNFMKVWSNTGWINAGSSVNGTTERYTYHATAGQTVFAATYEAGYIDVFLNGSKLENGVDFTAVTATSITLASPAALNDVVDIICYAVFELSTAPTKDVVAYTVSTVADLASVPSIYTTAIVKDIDRGGTFIWSSTGTANGGTVFAGATGFWTRQYSGAVNVKWFGAKGDGVTDDVVPIQAAINSGGKTIVLQNNHIITETLTLVGDIEIISNVSIEGNDTSFTIRKTTAGILFKYDSSPSAKGVVIRNVTLDGAGVATDGISISSYRNIIENVKIKHFAGNGLVIIDSVNWCGESTFSNLLIYDCDIGFKTGLQCLDSTLENSYVYNCRVGAQIAVDGGWNITGNHLYSNTEIDISILSTSSGRIIGNLFDAFDATALKIISNSASVTTIVESNIFTTIVSTTRIGIDLVINNSCKIKVSNNTFYSSNDTNIKCINKSGSGTLFGTMSSNTFTGVSYTNAYSIDSSTELLDTLGSTIYTKASSVSMGNSVTLSNGFGNPSSTPAQGSIYSAYNSSDASAKGATFIYYGGWRKLPVYNRWHVDSSAAPTTGTWSLGDIVYNNAPTAGGFIGWVCTTAGTPGTWKTFGAITA